MKTEILKNIEKYGSSYIRSITNGRNTHHKYDHIWSWLNQLYPELIGRRNAEKLYWLVHDLHEFPVCENCGRILSDQKSFKNFKAGYQRFCSLRCAALKNQKDPRIQRKSYATKMERYGDPHFNNHQKTEQTKLERYGDAKFNNSEKTKQTCLKRFGCVTPLHNKEIEKKIKDGNIEKYGNAVMFKTQYFKEKRVLTCREHYGVDYPMQAQENIEKRKRTSLERYGTEFPIRNEDVKRKQAATNIERYGYVSSMQSKAVQEKARATNRAKRSCDWPAQDRGVFLKQKKRYVYDGRSFDSKPEIAFYVWLKDIGANFEYQPDAGFEYEFEGKVRKYFPDFRVNDIYYEIKGGHMVSEDGVWICPWDRSQDARYKAKQECAERNGVAILTEKDYRKYVYYVKEKYGTKWLDGFKTEH